MQPPVTGQRNETDVRDVASRSFIFIGIGMCVSVEHSTTYPPVVVVCAARACVRVCTDIRCICCSTLPTLFKIDLHILTCHSWITSSGVDRKQ